jgi:hypothetical protein
MCNRDMCITTCAGVARYGAGDMVTAAGCRPPIGSSPGRFVGRTVGGQLVGDLLKDDRRLDEIIAALEPRMERSADSSTLFVA